MSRHSLFLLFFLSLSTSVLFAQDSKFGLKAGLNSVSFSGEDTEGFGDPNSGFIVGVMYDYTYTHRIGIQTGFNYAQNKIDTENSGDSSELTLGYINFPIVFKYYFNQNISVLVGPEFSLFSNATYTNGEDGSSIFKIGKTSGVLGAQYKFDMGLMIDLRYALGLTSIIADQEEYSGITLNTTSFDVKYNSAQITIGYLF